MRRRKTNPGIGTMLLIGTVTALAVGGAGYAIMQARKPKAKPKKKSLVCQTGYEVRVIDGIEVCLPIEESKPSSPKRPSSTPSGQVDDDGELIVVEQADIAMPAPRSILVSGTCPSMTRDVVFDYMTGTGTAAFAVEKILDRCGANANSAKRQAVLEFIVDVANANANLAGSLDLRSYALAAMAEPALS